MKLDIPEEGLFNIGNTNNVNNNNASKSASTSTSEASKIKINKKNFKENKTLVGWRLNTSTVDLIREYAFQSRMGINEFVQELLDRALENIDIE
jgi:hypothetical protein